MEPEEPNAADCCGSGCSPCVYDIYQQQLATWQKQTATGSQCTRTESLHRQDLLNETRFKPFRLLSRVTLAPGVLRLRFQPHTGQSDTVHYDATHEQVISGILPYEPGQHLFLRCILPTEESNDLQENTLVPEQKKKMVTRPYTPISVSKQEKHCCFDIFVKLYKEGVASEYFDRCGVGNILYWRGPSGGFRYEPHRFSHILMLCMGSGLAPMVPVIGSVLADEQDETVIHLKCGFHNMQHVILRDHLRHMTLYWNFTLEYHFSEQIENCSAKFGENFKNGRIEKTTLEEYILGKNLDKLLVLICGTELFSTEIKKSVVDLGVDITKNVHVF